MASNINIPAKKTFEVEKAVEPTRPAGQHAVVPTKSSSTNRVATDGLSPATSSKPPSDPGHLGAISVPKGKSMAAALSSAQTSLHGLASAQDLTRIPAGMSPDANKVYVGLLEVVREREAQGVKPPKVILVTDLAKDYDDLAALVVAKEMHRLGVIKIAAVIANLMPSDKRARFAQGALDALGLKGIPVGQGTAAADEEHEELDYEFDCSFMAPADKTFVSGRDLMRDVYKKAEAVGEKVSLVCLSSLQDVSEFATEHADLVKNNTASIHMQGEHTRNEAGVIVPSRLAANNRFHMESAEQWHQFIQQQNLPSTTYTKHAAFATPITSALFAEMAATDHPLGLHLRKVQVAQDLNFYARACLPNAADRFQPFMDQSWFLKNKTSWFDTQHPANEPLPIGEAVVPYLTRVVVYDALALLGASGQDVAEKLSLWQNPAIDATAHHQLGEASDPGIRPKAVASTLSALMLGSLRAVQQGIESQPVPA